MIRLSSAGSSAARSRPAIHVGVGCYPASITAVHNLLDSFVDTRYIRGNFYRSENTGKLPGGSVWFVPDERGGRSTPVKLLGALSS